MNKPENADPSSDSLNEALENASGGNVAAALDLFLGMKGAKASSEELAALKEFAASEAENVKSFDGASVFPKQDENGFLAKLAIIEHSQVKNHDQ